MASIDQSSPTFHIGAHRESMRLVQKEVTGPWAPVLPGYSPLPWRWRDQCIGTLWTYLLTDGWQFYITDRSCHSNWRREGWKEQVFYDPGGVYEITMGFRQEDSREENKQAGGISWWTCRWRAHSMENRKGRVAADYFLQTKHCALQGE